MEKNVQTIRPDSVKSTAPTIHPTSLSQDEFINYVQYMLDTENDMPVEWQRELLRRYMQATD